jgi:hypothetical protein
MAKEIVYIIYEENTHHEMRLAGVFMSLKHAKLYLKRRAKGWINDDAILKETLIDINKITDTELIQHGDEDFYVQLDDLGVTYYLHREPVL